MKKPKPRAILSWQLRPVRSRFLQQAEGSVHVCADEVVGTAYRTVYMTLCGKMNNSPRLTPLQHPPHQITIADIAMMKRVAFIRRNMLQVPRVAGVCQFIEIKYGRSFLRNPLQDEIRSDKPGATGDHNCVIHVRRACHSGRLFDCNKKSGNSIARLIKASKWTPPLQHGLPPSGHLLLRARLQHRYRSEARPSGAE